MAERNGMKEICLICYEQGLSLPSGHSMMSILVVLFVLYKYPSWMIFGFSILLEIFIVFEIIYLGTHTSNDVIIGFSFGLAWFAIYLALEKYFTSPKEVSLFLFLLFCFVLGPTLKFFVFFP
jgi:membrane-associated phospholipid phosphatase